MRQSLAVFLHVKPLFSTHNRLCNVGFEKLDQRPVQQGIAYGSDSDDEPQVAVGQKTEDDTDDHYGNITEHPGILKRNFAMGQIFYGSRNGDCAL